MVASMYSSCGVSCSVVGAMRILFKHFSPATSCAWSGEIKQDRRNLERVFGGPCSASLVGKQVRPESGRVQNQRAQCETHNRCAARQYAEVIVGDRFRRHELTHFGIWTAR